MNVGSLESLKERKAVRGFEIGQGCERDLKMARLHESLKKV